MAGSELAGLLRAGAQELGLVLPEKDIESCLIYLEELQKWNRKINLTAIRDERAIVIKHFLDSLAFRKGFAPVPGMQILDMGSGAGFPAIPLKILLPDTKVTLVESLRKKAAFLRHAVRTLQLSRVEVLESRIEDLPAVMDRTFDVVTARALALMEKVIDEGRRFLRPDGVMVLSRGPDETVRGNALDEGDMEVASRIEFVLPFSADRRSIWVFRKRP